MTTAVVSRAARLEQRVAALFSPRGGAHPGCMGIELEVLVDHPPAVPRERDVWRDALQRITPPGITLSTEPGGQLEFSTQPRPTLAEVDHDLATVFEALDGMQLRDGTRYATVGVDPWRDLGTARLQLRSPRYLAMQEHFDRRGPHGRQMMLLTAALQVGVDLQPGGAANEQWDLAHLMGPVLSSAFSSAHPSAVAVANPRLAIWLGIDPTRTGFDGRHLRWGDPVAAYADFARRAQVIVPSRPLDLLPGSTFEDWCRHDDHSPTDADVACHLTTLFPPVRPRGRYLEIRYLDALPLATARVALPVLGACLLEPVTRRRALCLLRPLAEDLGAWWHRAATAGITDPVMHDLAGELFEIAGRGMRDMPVGYLPAESADRVRQFLRVSALASSGAVRTRSACA